MNITIDFMLQMPDNLKHLFQDYNIRMYEDLSAYKSNIRIFSQKMISPFALNLVIAIPQFEANTFKTRKFELCFEEKMPSGEEKPLETPPELIKFLIRIAGQDFLIMEQMQTDIQKHIKYKNRPKEGKTDEDIERYKKLQLKEFNDIIESANPYVRPPQMGKLVETLNDDILGRAFMMGPINCEA